MASTHDSFQESDAHERVGGAGDAFGDGEGGTPPVPGSSFLNFRNSFIYLWDSGEEVLGSHTWIYAFNPQMQMTGKITLPETEGEGVPYFQRWAPLSPLNSGGGEHGLFITGYARAPGLDPYGNPHDAPVIHRYDGGLNLVQRFILRSPYTSLTHPIWGTHRWALGSLVGQGRRMRSSEVLFLVHFRWHATFDDSKFGRSLWPPEGRAGDNTDVGLARLGGDFWRDHIELNPISPGDDPHLNFVDADHALSIRYDPLIHQEWQQNPFRFIGDGEAAEVGEPTAGYQQKILELEAQGLSTVFEMPISGGGRDFHYQAALFNFPDHFPFNRIGVIRSSRLADGAFHPDDLALTDVGTTNDFIFSATHDCAGD